MIETYIAISPFPRGSFGWAMDQLKAGNYVRRHDWPIEVEVSPRGGERVDVWRLYPNGDGAPCQGFSPGVVGADNDSWGDLGTDSGGYSPSVDDRLALDWQFLSDVTPAQVAYLDQHRMTRTPNIALAEYDAGIKRYERASNLKGAAIFFAVVALLVYAFLHHP